MNESKEFLGNGIMAVDDRVNARVNRIRRIFKWAVSEEVVPPSVIEGLRAVEGLRRGCSNVREAEPVGPGSRCVGGRHAVIPAAGCG